MPNLRFIDNTNKQRRNFISLSYRRYGPLDVLDFNFRRVRLHLAK